MDHDIHELIPHVYTKLGSEFPITSVADLISLTLLDIRSITIEQSLNLGYKNYDTAQKCLKLLSSAKKNFLICEYFKTSNNRHVAYFLSHNGFQHAYSLRNDYLNSDHTNIKEKYPNPSDIKLKPMALPHATKTNDIYFTLLKSPYIKEFKWFDERRCIVTNSNGTAVFRNDAKFIVNNKVYLVEQDMGTESPGILQRKFTQIADHVSNLNEMPSIVFQIDLSSLINPKRKKILFNKSAKSKISNYQKKINKLQIIYKIFKERNMLTVNDLVEEVRNLDVLLNNDSMLSYISNKEISNMKNNRHLLNELSNSRGEVPFPTLKDIKLEIDSLNEELNPIKNSALADFLKPKYEERKNIVKGIVLDTSKKDTSSIYDVMLDGLDLFVGSNLEISNLFANNILNPSGYREILVEYVCNILKSHTDLALIDVQDLGYKQFAYKHQEFKIKNHYRFIFEGGQETNILIEDLVCNIGSFARFNKLANIADSDLIDKNDYYAFYFIVDTFDTAKKYWSSYSLKRFMEYENINIFFTDIDTLIHSDVKCYQISINGSKI
ncbi:hypothetical protein [Wukongibacter baidiensis]